MEINRDNVLEICRKSDIHPSKDYGQNFLIEPDACERIVDLLDIQKDEKVLEIGPGIGSVTHFLSLYSNEIDAIDIDNAMVSFLNLFYKEAKNVKIIENDIRKHDISPYQKIIGNLPYNITTEIIVYLLTAKSIAERMVLMCQLETFAHFFDVKGSEYGPTSVLIHLLGNIEKGFIVKRGCFYPVPNVDSIVFKIDIENKYDKVEVLKAYKLSKSLFLNRRKTILNNLGNYLKDKEKALEYLTKLNILPNLRPEQIAPEKYLELSKLLNVWVNSFRNIQYRWTYDLCKKLR